MRPHDFRPRPIRLAATILISLIALALLLILPDSYRTHSSSLDGHLNQSRDNSPSQESPEDKLVEERRARALPSFENWTKEYLSAGATKSLTSKGVEVAKARRAVIKELIQSDPKRAITLAASPELRANLPADIRGQLEEPVSAYGDLFVYVVMIHGGRHSADAMMSSRIEREVVIGKSIYKAFVSADAKR